MAHKLSDREWEAWVEFLQLPLAQEFFKALDRKGVRLRKAWEQALWAARQPDPSLPNLQETRSVSMAYQNLAQLGQSSKQVRHLLEELLHDESKRDQPD